MTPRERKYLYSKQRSKFWRKFFKGDATLHVNPFMMFEYTSQGLKIVESGKPGEGVTITLTKYNLPNNSSLSKGQLN